MFEIFRRLGNKNIRMLADISTIGVFALAVWAIFNPDIVAEYVQKVARNTNEIASSSFEISKDTRLLSEEIPYWLQIEESRIGSSKPQNTSRVSFAAFRLVNPTNFPIKNIKVSIISNGKKIDELTTFTLPPLEKVWLKSLDLPDVVEEICISGISARQGKRVYEWRKVLLDENGRNFFGNGNVEGIFSDWEFTKEPREVCKA